MGCDARLMDSSKVISRSNSDLLAIQMIAANTSMSTVARMEAIAEYSHKWFTDTRLHPSQRSIATEEYKRRKNSHSLFE